MIIKTGEIMEKNENWYTVSIVMSIKLKEGKQEVFPIFEKGYIG